MRHVTLRPETSDLLLQGHDLDLLGAHLAMARERTGRRLRQLSHPASQHALGHIEVAGRACATATPRSITSFTASSLNSRLNVRLISILRSQGHDLIVVSTKPAAGHLP